MLEASLSRCWPRQEGFAPTGPSSPPIRDPASESRRLPMLSLPQSCSEPDLGREAEVVLVAELAGGRTILRRQHVGYPFHITRAFQLDRMRPDLAALYLQPTSGGLYAPERLGVGNASGE